MQLGEVVPVPLSSYVPLTPRIAVNLSSTAGLNLRYWGHWSTKVSDGAFESDNKISCVILLLNFTTWPCLPFTYILGGHNIW